MSTPMSWNRRALALGWLAVSGLPTLVEARAVEAPLAERFRESEVIARVRVEAVSDTDPPGPFRQTARLQVLLPFKGCVRGQTLTIDYDTGTRCPNVLYQKGEDCLVFLDRQRNGRLTTFNDDYGKYFVEGSVVRGWSVKLFSHRDTSLTAVLRQIRKTLGPKR